MKREFALILEIYNNDTAKVQLQRSSSCMCFNCKPIVLRAFNKINANIGDNVIMEIEDFKKGANFFVYIVPLICIIIGYFLGEYITNLVDINHNLGSIFLFIVFFIYVILGIKKLKKDNENNSQYNL